MSKGGKYLQKKPPIPRKKKVALIVVCTLAVILLAAGIFGVTFYNSILDHIGRAEVVEKDYTMNEELEQMMGVMDETTEAVETTEPTTVPTTLPYTPSEQDIINILLVGQAGRPDEPYHMADTMILATINKQTKVLTLTSFLRDTYVKLPDYMGHTCGRNRINVCYHLGWTWGDTGGAMEMTNICLKNNFGIDVDYNVEVDFEAFSQIIQILGGVKVTLTEAEAEYLNGHGKTWQEVHPGEITLYGDAALSYARMRKADGDNESDIKRTARQRNLMNAIFEKVKDDGFDKLKQIAEEVLPMITTDMTNEEITTCIWEILPILPELKIETGTCPAPDTYWGEVIDLLGTQSSVLKYDEQKNKQIMMAITEGTAN